jgi:hypothetical protein
MSIFVGGLAAAPASAQGVDGSTTMITIDAPAKDQTVRVGEEVGIGGWAADVAAPGGVDIVEVYLDGKKDEGGTLIGQATYGKARSDVASVLKSPSFTNVGFDLVWKVNASVGDHIAFVYVHSPNGWNYLTQSFKVSNAPAPSTQSTQGSTSSQGYSSSTSQGFSSSSSFGTNLTAGQPGGQPWGQYVASLTPANAAQSAAIASSRGGSPFATTQSYGQQYGVGSTLGTQYSNGQAYAAGYPYGTTSPYATTNPYATNAYNSINPYATNTAYGLGYPYTGGTNYGLGYQYGASNLYGSNPYGSAYQYGGTNPYAIGYGFGGTYPYTSGYGYGAGYPTSYGYGAGYGYTSPYSGYGSLGYTGYGNLGYTGYGGLGGYSPYAGYGAYAGYGYQGYNNNGLGY